VTIRRVPLVLSSYSRAKKLAAYEVARAIRQGRLPHLRKVRLPCVDCGSVAENWEHRDYNKPLKVEAVCHSCNLLRGRGSFEQEVLEVPLEPLICAKCDYKWIPHVKNPKVCPNCGSKRKSMEAI